LTRSLPAAVAAGLEASRTFGFAEALGHFERALAIWDRVPDAAVLTGLDHVELLRRAAGAASTAGRADRAVAPIASAPGGGGEEARARGGAPAVCVTGGGWAWRVGGGERSRGASGRAGALVPADPPSPARAEALASLGQVLMLTGRLMESADRCREAIAIASE